jgi:hypothetical protein
MLVTVDVTGTWTGDWVQSRGIGGGGGADIRGRAELRLQQEGPNVTGSMTVTGYGGTRLYNLRSLPDNTPVQGTVNGDVLKLSASGVEFELLVAGDQMGGSYTGRGQGKIELIRVSPGERGPTR